MAERGWWVCPNEPPCPHAGAFHDIEEPGDPLPQCCVEGCKCGHDKELRRRMWAAMEVGGDG